MDGKKIITMRNFYIITTTHTSIGVVQNEFILISKARPTIVNVVHRIELEMLELAEIFVNCIEEITEQDMKDMTFNGVVCRTL